MPVACRRQLARRPQPEHEVPIRARHDPARLLPEWERRLATVAATGAKAL